MVDGAFGSFVTQDVLCFHRKKGTKKPERSAKYMSVPRSRCATIPSLYEVSRTLNPNVQPIHADISVQKLQVITQRGSTYIFMQYIFTLLSIAVHVKAHTLGMHIYWSRGLPSIKLPSEPLALCQWILVSELPGTQMRHLMNFGLGR